MVDKQALANGGSGMNLDARLPSGSLGNPSGPEIMSAFVQLMRHPVIQDGPEAGIKKHLGRGLDSQIPLPDNLNFFIDILDNSHAAPLFMPRDKNGIKKDPFFSIRDERIRGSTLFKRLSPFPFFRVTCVLTYPAAGFSFLPSACSPDQLPDALRPSLPRKLLTADDSFSLTLWMRITFPFFAFSLIFLFTLYRICKNAVFVKPLRLISGNIPVFICAHAYTSSLM